VHRLFGFDETIGVRAGSLGFLQIRERGHSGRVPVIQYVMSVDTSGKIRTFSGRLGGEYTV
jgi:hypothetical protein